MTRGALLLASIFVALAGAVAASVLIPSGSRAGYAAIERITAVTAACEEHAPPSVKGWIVFLAGARAAGDVAETARETLGRELKPWSELPWLHPVATCVYSKPGSPVDGPTKTYLVDGTGRWTVDPL